MVHNPLVFHAFFHGIKVPIGLNSSENHISHAECAEHERNEEEHNLEGNVSLVLDILHFFTNINDNVILGRCINVG